MFRPIIFQLFRARSWLWSYAREVRRSVQPNLPPNVDQVTEYLYVGGFVTGKDWHALKAHGITVDVSLQAERRDEFGGDLPEGYLWLPTMDHSAPSQLSLRLGTAFILAAITEKKKILIHCHAGKGRSALLCAAVLIAQGNEINEAWAIVKKGRTIASLHEKQWEALRLFNQEYQGAACQK